MKSCPRCKHVLPIRCFGTSKRDGIQSYCKTCKAEKAKEYYKKNPQKVLQRADKYRQTIRGILVNRYSDMKRRCSNPKHKFYKYYGGRGIKCLFKSSKEFVDYVISILKVDPRDLDIDRIDNDGNYEPGNIQFVTHRENQKNRRYR